MAGNYIPASCQDKEIDKKKGAEGVKMRPSDSPQL